MGLVAVMKPQTTAKVRGTGSEIQGQLWNFVLRKIKHYENII